MSILEVSVFSDALADRLLFDLVDFDEAFRLSLFVVIEAVESNERGSVHCEVEGLLESIAKVEGWPPLIGWLMDLLRVAIECLLG